MKVIYMTNPHVPATGWRRWLLFSWIFVCGCCLLLFIASAIINVTQPKNSVTTTDTEIATTTIRKPTASATSAPTIAPTASATPAPTEVPTSTPIPITDIPVDEYLANMVPETLGYFTTYDKPRLVEVTTLFGATPDVVGHKLVTIRADNNISNNLIVAAMLVDAVKYFSAISQNPNVMKLDSVTILFTFPMVDKYGNTNEQGINRIMLTTKTMAMINWELFKNGGHRRLVDAADKYVLNAAFR